MIETPEAVRNAAEIAAVPGVDVLLIGTSDLTASMGIAGQIGHPDVRAAYETVAKACSAAGKTLGMGGVYDETHAPTYIKLGARFLLSRLRPHPAHGRRHRPQPVPARPPDPRRNGPSKYLRTRRNCDNPGTTPGDVRPCAFSAASPRACPC